MTSPRPITLIGAGGIAQVAHLPAYALAGLPVTAVHDLDLSRASALQSEFKIPHRWDTLVDAVRHAPANAVFDVAVPAPHIAAVLEQLPIGAAVLIQKPMGENLADARTLLQLCTRRQLRAAVNFQLRFAPCVAAARALIADGTIGELHDLEVRVTVHTPWHLWDFLIGQPRVEILYHSIHYIDLLRSFLGEPTGVYAKTVKSPAAPQLAATRSAIILDYGETVRATITANHGHDFGPDHQESYIKWEGTHGALKARMGALVNYPDGGGDDSLHLYTRTDDRAPEWRPVPITGNWFPHAFAGPMAALMQWADGEADTHPTRVEDAIHTMAVTEAAYLSNQSGSTPVPSP